VSGAICAAFVGGPWHGTYRVLQDSRDRWLVPVLEPLSLRELTSDEAADPAAHVSVRTGEYRRGASYRLPENGLYQYHWSPPR
jgi:hypothetical protein